MLLMWHWIELYIIWIFHSAAVLGRLFPDWHWFSELWCCCALSKSLSSWVASRNCILLSNSCWHASWLCWASVRLLPSSVASCSVSKLITSQRLSSENEMKNAGSFLILIKRSDDIFSVVSPASVRSNSMLSFVSKLAPKLPEPDLPWLELKPVDLEYSKEVHVRISSNNLCNTYILQKSYSDGTII